MNKLASVVFVMLGTLGAAHAAAPVGNAVSGQEKAAMCAGCHGMDGNSMVPMFPKLSGQHAEYITKQLQAFKAGDRQDPTMSPMAEPLSAQDVADLAAHFSAQAKSVGTADPEKAKRGAAIYRGGVAAKGVAACTSCHGPSGSGNPTASFPSLSGQHATYVTKALQDFRSGTRTTDPARMMRDVAAKMSDEEIEAVAEFIAGLH